MRFKLLPHCTFWFISFTLICHSTLAQPEQQKQLQEQINDELYFTQISDHVYMITHYFPYWGGNSLVVLTEEDQAVLIDTPYDGVATEALLAWMKQRFGKLRIAAIVTGFHQDNLGGNEILIQRGIPVYGMELTADLVKTEGDEFKKIIVESVKGNEDPKYYQRYARLQLTPPDHLIEIGPDMGHSLEIGNLNFELYFPGETHTVDNSVVYVHELDILFGGCMIRALRDQRPGYIKYANMEQWPLSVELVKRRFPKSKIVIPGHGFEGEFELLQHTIDILNAWNNDH